MKHIHKYATFVKIEHTLFSVPLLFSGALMAERQWPSLRESLLIILAGASARIVAMALNRIIDRNIDRENPRTRERHLASGKMGLLEAWVLVVFSLGIYLVAAWSLSDFCLKWSWLPLMAFGAYPYFKRFTKWAHVGLGLVWSLIPLGGFLAIKAAWVDLWPAITLGLFCVFWLAGFDIIYATLDEDFDRRAGLHSLPSKWGSQKALRMATFFHLLAYITLILFYGIWLSGPITVMLLVIIGILLFLEQKFSHYVNVAFFQINAVIGFVVLVFTYTGVKGY